MSVWLKSPAPQVWRNKGFSFVLFLQTRQRGMNVSYKAEYTDNAEKYAIYENSTHGLRRPCDYIFILAVNWNRE